MGIFDFLTGGSKPPPNGVRAVAQVVSSTRHTPGSMYQNCRMDLVIHAPGIAAFATGFHGLVNHKHWPRPGMTLPVVVDPHNPANFTILWNEVPDNRTTGRQTAESIAAAMRGEPNPGQSFSGGFSGAQVQFAGDPSRLTEDQKAKLRALGIDPNQIPGAAAQPAPPPDPIAQLERLAALRAQGILSDAEFEAQKRRILGT